MCACGRVCTYGSVERESYGGTRSEIARKLNASRGDDSEEGGFDWRFVSHETPRTIKEQMYVHTSVGEVVQDVLCGYVGKAIVVVAVAILLCA